MWLVANSGLKKAVLQEAQNGPNRDHSGVKMTLERVKRAFYWKELSKDVCAFVAECDVCRRNKTENISPPGLLKPLLIPDQVWTDISIDFIESLPKSQENDVIFVVVDRLSKYAHFMIPSHPYTDMDVAQSFLDNVYKLYGMPRTVVSDRDLIFCSKFWQGLFKL